MLKNEEYDEEGVERRRTVSYNLHKLQLRDKCTHTTNFYVFLKCQGGRKRIGGSEG